MKIKWNKAIKVCSILSVLIIIALLSIIMLNSVEGYRVVRIAEVNGNVTVVRDGIEYKAYKGMNVQEGAVLVTSAGSNVRMVLDDDKYVKLEAGSRMTFETLGVLGSGNTALKLERGSVTSEIVKPLAVDESFIVNTPNAVLAVRGTYFRVDLSMNENGDTTTDVLTYGGTVASNRIMPDGQVVEEEVLIEVGYKAKINMDTKDTVYVVDEAGVEGEGKGKKTTKIKLDDIPDEDLVDIYFASENGHDMFIKTEEIKKNIEIRDIKLEEYTSVYDKVKELDRANEVVVADDSMPLIQEEEKEETVTSTFGAPYDGAHTHKESRTTVDATCLEDGLTTVTCDTCGMVVQEVVIAATGHTDGEAVVTLEETCTTDGTLTTNCTICGAVTKEEVIPMTGHTDGEPEMTTPATCTQTGMLTTRCTVCEAITKEEVIAMLEHTQVTNIVAATCTTKGKETVSCSDCGLIFSEKELDITAHTEEKGGTSDCHSKCNVCGVTLSKEHTYTSVQTKAPTCTEKGETTHTCECGYTYKTEVPATGHTEVKGGTKDCHVKCSTCGVVLQAEKAHSYTSSVTKAATCTATGVRTYTCACGYSYTEEIAATGHSYKDMIDEPTDMADGREYEECSNCGDEINISPIIAINAVNFPDETLRTYVEANYNTNGIKGLNVSEIGKAIELQIESDAVTTMKGIEYLTALESIVVVDGSGISDGELDISKNTALQQFGIYNMEITSIDTSKNTELQMLLLTGANITSIDLSNNKSLNYLYVDSTELTSLDVSGNTNLQYLVARESKIADLNVDGCTSLTCLQVPNTQLKSLDVSSLTSLNELDCGYDDITSIDLSANTQLTNLILDGSAIDLIDVSLNVNLNRLSANECSALTVIKISVDENTEHALRYIYVDDCTNLVDINVTNCSELVSLDTSTCTALESLLVSGTGLENVDVTANTSLSSLEANNCTSLNTVNAAGVTTLSSIETNNCTMLTTLDVSGSIVSNIDSAISGSTSLEVLDINGCTGVTEFDPSMFINLKDLDIGGTGITNLDLVNNVALTNLVATGSALTGALDYTYLTNLVTLELGNITEITSINVSNVDTLERLVVTGCSVLNTIRATDCTSLTYLGFSRTLAVTHMYLERTAIPGSAGSANFNLYNDNKIQVLRFDGNTALNCLQISGANTLTEVSIVGCTGLTQFHMTDYTGTITIDGSTCTSLTTISTGNSSGLTFIRP